MTSKRGDLMDKEKDDEVKYDELVAMKRRQMWEVRILLFVGFGIVYILQWPNVKLLIASTGLWAFCW